MKVRHAERLAICSVPESCVGVREDVGEALTGAGIGQPLSRERFFFSGADIVTKMESKTTRCAIASLWPTRRGQRPWHVRKSLTREPGDLGIGRHWKVGPHRGGEEP